MATLCTPIQIAVEDFQPSERQRYCKMRLHQYVSSQVIATLNPLNIQHLRLYFHPVPMDEIQVWVRDDNFWFWFATANDQHFKLEAMKGKAVNVLKKALVGKLDDPKVAAIQLKAAQLILNMSDKTPANTINNTSNTLVTGDRVIPKSLSKKPESELKTEIMRLRELNRDSMIEEDSN